MRGNRYRPRKWKMIPSHATSKRLQRHIGREWHVNLWVDAAAHSGPSTEEPRREKTPAAMATGVRGDQRHVDEPSGECVCGGRTLRSGDAGRSTWKLGSRAATV